MYLSLLTQQIFYKEQVCLKGLIKKLLHYHLQCRWLQVWWKCWYQTVSIIIRNIAMGTLNLKMLSLT